DDNTTSVTYTAKVGATLGSVLENVEPTAIDALKFGGWFVESQPVDESATVTAEGLTLTAKYLAGYTVSEYTQNVSGAYGEAKVTTGEAWYGEPFIYEYKVPEHYAFGEKPTGDGYVDVKFSTQSLQKNDTFTVYYVLDQVTATYHLNPPEQSGVSDEQITDTVYYGSTATAKAVSDFASSLSEDYRFAGWATSPDGEMVYDAGETVTFDSNAAFYAKWDVAKTDVNGGSDKLFLSSKKGESGVILLCREGVAEKRGTVNAAGVFTFTEDEKTVLDGCIDGDTFYYYIDTLQKEYKAFDGTAETMEFKAHGEAVYTPAEGEAIIGSYQLNAEDGTFYFVGGEDKGFVFTLTNKEGKTVFRTVSEEAGYYALKTDEGYDYDVIYFDGLGRLTYFLAEENGEVTDVHGAYDCTDKDTKTYAISLYSETGTNVLDIAVRLEKQSGTLGDYTLSGVYQVGDDYAGRYSVYGSSYYPDIYVLDGFGSGTKNGKPGTYTIEQTESWSTLQNSVIYEVAVFWVRFTGEDGVSVDLDFGEDLYDTTVTIIAEGSLYGKYDFESAAFVNGVYYNDAFFEIENKGTYGGKYAYLWIGTQSVDGTVIYVKADEGSVFGYGNEYTFQNIAYQSFAFTVSGNTVSCTDIGITIFDDETGT
ncbi:MAG: InlB B-repeat-containing protein, partial [Clostridia bacterium]|nr:InlB B-repeat-containing protein [Clostridia bacterium]